MRRNDRLTWRAVAQVCGIMLVLVSCDSVEPQQPEEPVENGLSLEAHSATSLSGIVGAKSDSIPTVRLTTRDGAPAPGREVRFIVSGGGSIEITSQRTDTAGVASPGTWTLGTVPGPQTLTARADGVADVVFTAVAQPGRPVTVAIVAGDNQTAAVGGAAPDTVEAEGDR